MEAATAGYGIMTEGSDIDFFGAHIKVSSARLAALLNSSVTEDVVVVGKRALDLVSADDRELDMNLALDDDGADPLEDLDADDEVVERLATCHEPVVKLRPVGP